VFGAGLQAPFLQFSTLCDRNLCRFSRIQWYYIWYYSHMSRCKKLRKAAETSPAGLRYSELKKLLECWGYHPRLSGRKATSHRVWRHESAGGSYKRRTIYDEKGNVSVAQVKHVLEAIEWLESQKDNPYPR
jgi:hypothetical protein